MRHPFLGGYNIFFLKQMLILACISQNVSIKLKLNRNRDQWHVVWSKFGDILEQKSGVLCALFICH